MISAIDPNPLGEKMLRLIALDVDVIIVATVCFGCYCFPHDYLLKSKNRTRVRERK